ncbi:MAG: L,D-transpeptidase family protein [Sphingomonas bacterium]|nr:L,D-transpeptidase family protein [Sphingomonas bacterium]
MMRALATLLTAVAATLIASAPAEARKKKQPVAAPPAPQVALPASANGVNVRYYYERRQYPAIWFGAKGGDAAISQLLTILRRAPIDGMNNGPTVAASVEAAVQRARTSNDPMQVKAAELAMAAAWADYVQAIKRPSTNVIYGDPALAQTTPHPDRTLALAEAAPSLAQHLQSVASINPYYSAIRDVAIAEAAANGGRPSDKALLNLERARIIPGSGKYILVNSAEQRLHMIEGGQDVGSMKVVVGDPIELKLPTPIIASTMYYAIANPYWHVPTHLIKKFAPAIAKSPAAYLKSRNYEIISDFGKNPQILEPSSVDWKAVAAGTATTILRQRPGGQNSMGKMKFPFPNKEGIFLHDTPTRTHFAKENRNISNGCIRVEDYRRLANWLFGRDIAAVGTDPEQHIAMQRGVPVFVTYLTMVPSSTGMASFEDRYGWDRPGAMAGGMSAGSGAISVGGGASPK